MNFLFFLFLEEKFSEYGTSNPTFLMSVKEKILLVETSLNEFHSLRYRTFGGI